MHPIDKRIGYLSFGHWQPGTPTPDAAAALRQAVELAAVAEEIGVDGAFHRVHHFARQHSAPFPLLAAAAAVTTRIELGTGVIDMRYENPLHMAEQAATADLISAGRLQLGMSRGSPEPAYRGAEAFGYSSVGGRADDDVAREKTARFRAAIAGAGVAPRDVGGEPAGPLLPIEPQAPGLADRIWWGSASRASATWAGEQGMNLMSSTLLLEDTGVPFAELQLAQIEAFRAAWEAAGWHRTPRVSVSRSVIPVTGDLDRRLLAAGSRESVGYLDGASARFGRTFVGEPDVIASELREDPAIAAADTVLVTIPNQLGVEYNAQLLRTIVDEVAPAAGWRTQRVAEPAERR